ncbi:MAG: ribonuclease H-like domain-containing protein [Chloroflexi bacterium]|nr:ribonuclease H-like domain-containing protein [Chloroflexota bacterium]
MDAYLDIETTGLSWFNSEITVVGLYLVTGKRGRLVQMVGDNVNRNSLLSLVNGADAIYTYNGARFDLPFIDASLGIDLASLFVHRDLMYDCWKCNLYGGFKAVEQELGIPRHLKGINGFDAVLLWQEYRHRGDQKALKLLLDYNREDVVNLKALKEKLDIML